MAKNQYLVQLVIERGETPETSGIRILVYRNDKLLIKSEDLYNANDANILVGVIQQVIAHNNAKQPPSILSAIRAAWQDIKTYLPQFFGLNKK